MAASRCEIPEVVVNSSGQPVSGASVQVNIHGAGAATIYLAETGGTTIANPITTDSNGRIEGWVNEGSYDLVVSGTGIITYTQYYEAVKGNNSAGPILTTTGDILYASSADAVARLPIGTTGQSLVVAGGIPAWGSGPFVVYRKTTAKAATNTITETDLLNGEIQVAANAMGTSGLCRLTAWGDWINNSGGVAAVPRFKVKLGAGPTVIIDTGAPTGMTGVNQRFGWRIAVEIMNLGATNSQWVNLKLDASHDTTAANSAAFVTGNGWTHSIAGTSGTGYVYAEGSNSSAIDTTVAMNVLLTVINGSATTTETKLFGAVVEVF